jgi:hypothetical protein
MFDTKRSDKVCLWLMDICASSGGDEKKLLVGIIPASMMARKSGEISFSPKLQRIFKYLSFLFKKILLKASKNKE